MARCYPYKQGKLHRNWKTAKVLPCPSCEKLFWFPPSAFRKDQTKAFCSQECNLEYRSKHKDEYYINSPEFLARVKPLISGSNHHNWKMDSKYRYRQDAIKLFGNTCQKCGKIKETGIHVHHKDFDSSNNPEDGSNWIILCRSCHSTAHDFTKNFKGKARWQKLLKC